MQGQSERLVTSGEAGVCVTGGLKRRSLGDVAGKGRDRTGRFEAGGECRLLRGVWPGGCACRLGEGGSDWVVGGERGMLAGEIRAGGGTYRGGTYNGELFCSTGGCPVARE